MARGDAADDRPSAFRRRLRRHHRLTLRKHDCFPASERVCGYPDASNTGVSPGVALQPSGCVSANTPGQVIEKPFDQKTAPSTSSARDVIIRNVKIVIDDPEKWAIIIRNPGSATIDHVDISGVDAAAHDVPVRRAVANHRADHRQPRQPAQLLQLHSGRLRRRVGQLHPRRRRARQPPTSTASCASPTTAATSAPTTNTVLSKGIAIALYGDFRHGPVDSTISNNLVGGGKLHAVRRHRQVPPTSTSPTTVSRARSTPRAASGDPLAYVYPRQP